MKDAPFEKAGARLRKARQASGISLRELAASANLSPAFLSGVERGIHRPSLESARWITRRLGVEPDVQAFLYREWQAPDLKVADAWEQAIADDGRDARFRSAVLLTLNVFESWMNRPDMFDGWAVVDRLHGHLRDVAENGAEPMFAEWTADPNGRFMKEMQ